MLDRNRPQHVSRCVIANEGGEGVPETRTRLERSVHHYLSFFVLSSCRPLVPVGVALR